MTYADAIRFLYDLQLFGLKLGLENTRRLAALAGDPQARLRFIHVAGTNGKGIDVRHVGSVYRAAGRRVGLFTSPHLVSFRERIQVDREPIGEAGVVALVRRIREWLEAFPADHSPTFFEVVTVMALSHFRECGCDLVIWETGMGGRLDATNIVTPLASVITNIQFDHEQWLGNTLPKIAAEKAGIIKPGVPVITGADAPRPLAVIRAAASLADARLIEVTPADGARPPLDRLDLALAGEHQRANAVVALATIDTLQAVLPVSPDAVEAGLRNVEWAGRLQTIETAPGCVTLLDGAHNPAGVTALEHVDAVVSGRRPVMIFGALRDKDWGAMCHRLAPLAEAVFLVPVASHRSAAPAELESACRITAAGVPVHLCPSLAEAIERTRTAPFRLITGSLYLIGEALEQLGAATAGGMERGLNEWQRKP